MPSGVYRRTRDNVNYSANANVRSERVFNFLISFHKQNKWMPTIRQIMVACDLPSTSIVSFHLRRLQAWGAIYHEFNESRAIRILKHPKADVKFGRDAFK